MNRRQIITGSAVAAVGAALGTKTDAAEPLNFHFGVRPGDAKTRAGAIERLPARYHEDRVLIERIQSTPERRIFYVDCGNMSRGRAERHMREVVARHKGGVPFEQANMLPPRMRA